jgi:hypothetical protein
MSLCSAAFGYCSSLWTVGKRAAMQADIVIYILGEAVNLRWI